MYLHLFYVYAVILLISFVTAQLSMCMVKPLPAYLKTVYWFLLVTVVIEVIAGYWSHLYGRNHWVYNIYMVLQFYFFCVILYQLCNGKKLRTAFFIAGLIYLIATIVRHTFWLHQFNYFNFPCLYIGDVIVIVFSCYCINELFKQRADGGILKMPAFWILVAILLTTGGLGPLLLPMAVPLRLNHAELDMLNLVMFGVNYLIYISFTMAFLYSFKQRKLLAAVN
jgi:hypothetical protein